MSKRITQQLEIFIKLMPTKKKKKKKTNSYVYSQNLEHNKYTTITEEENSSMQ